MREIDLHSTMDAHGLRKLNEVHEKYKHLDKLLSDKCLNCDFKGQILREFWEVIKETYKRKGL